MRWLRAVVCRLMIDLVVRRPVRGVEYLLRYNV